MKTAFSEYHEEVIKPALGCLSRHWKGYIALVAVVYGVMMAGWWIYWYSEEISKFFAGIRYRFTRKEAA